MTALMVDVESVIRAWLQQQLPTATVGTETPADLEAHLPFVQPVRIGGGDDGVTLDAATMSIHTFGVDRASARTLGYQVRAALFDARGVVFQNATVTRVATIGGPAWTPYDNTNIRRTTGTYQVRIKSA